MIEIKYMGSKSRIAKDIVSIIQKYIDDNKITTYIEPFVGGCNVIDKIKCENKQANDSNEYLIAFWQALQQGWNPLDIHMTKKLYDDIKSNKSGFSFYILPFQLSPFIAITFFQQGSYSFSFSVNRILNTSLDRFSYSSQSTK